jgi:prepilin-type N-terminal cleavage/methylation domain-containing protein
MAGHDNKKGLTLVEMLVGSAIFSFLVLVLFGMVQTGTAAYIAEQARNGMERMVREIRQSRASSVTVNDAHSDTVSFSTPTRTNVRYYRSGTNLVREYPLGTVKIIAINIGHLKFVKTGSQMTINIQAQTTMYSRTFSFVLFENVKLRNE